MLNCYRHSNASKIGYDLFFSHLTLNGQTISTIPSVDNSKVLQIIIASTQRPLISFVNNINELYSVVSV